jgi:hypothetical protein
MLTTKALQRMKNAGKDYKTFVPKIFDYRAALRDAVIMLRITTSVGQYTQLHLPLNDFAKGVYIKCII